MAGRLIGAGGGGHFKVRIGDLCWCRPRGPGAAGAKKQASAAINERLRGDDGRFGPGRPPIDDIDCDEPARPRRPRPAE